MGAAAPVGTALPPGMGTGLASAPAWLCPPSWCTASRPALCVPWEGVQGWAWNVLWKLLLSQPLGRGFHVAMSSVGPLAGRLPVTLEAPWAPSGQHTGPPSALLDAPPAGPWRQCGEGCRPARALVLLPGRRLTSSGAPFTSSPPLNSGAFCGSEVVSGRENVPFRFCCSPTVLRHSTRCPFQTCVRELFLRPGSPELHRLFVPGTCI